MPGEGQNRDARDAAPYPLLSPAGLRSAAIPAFNASHGPYGIQEGRLDLDQTARLQALLNDAAEVAVVAAGATEGAANIINSVSGGISDASGVTAQLGLRAVCVL